MRLNDMSIRKYFLSFQHNIMNGLTNIPLFKTNKYICGIYYSIVLIQINCEKKSSIDSYFEVRPLDLFDLTKVMHQTKSK